MALIEHLIVEAADTVAAEKFYATAFGLESRVQVRPATAPTSGFRGFTMSLIVASPATVDGFIAAAVEAGGAIRKPPAKSLWGYGGVVQAPDGAICKVATSAKRDRGPATRDIDRFVVLLGVADVAATKRFYEERGVGVAKSYGRKYVEFDAGSSPVGFGLYGRRALAKDAGVAPDGSGSHCLAIAGGLGAFTDPDGFAWEDAAG